MVFKITRLIAIFSLLTLLGSWLAQYVDPNIFWPVAFLGLIFPIALVIYLISCSFLVYRNKKWLWMLMPSLVVLFSMISRTINISPSQSEEGALRVMTFNIKAFDLYNWDHNVRGRESIMEVIETADPDILCIQEFYTDPKQRNISYIVDELGFEYYFFCPTTTLQGGEKWGVATFSKLPIVEKEIFEFSNSKNNICIISTIALDDTLVEVYNMHLQSIHLSDEDYDYIEELSDNQQPDVLSTRKIVRKLKVAYEKRAKQAAEIRVRLDQSEYLNLVCGDFNDLPVSYTYRLIKGNMKDVFTSKGNGFARTYLEFTPWFRIDYILIDKSWSVNGLQTIAGGQSDHQPVIADLNFNN